MTDAPPLSGTPANPIPMRVGMTAPEAFPAAEMAEAAGRAILDIGKDFAFYPGDLGHPGLREVLARREADREGVDFDPDEIALTNGSMQAVTLVGRVLMEGPGDVVITEETTYSGTLGAYRGLGYRLVGVPLDEHGMDIGELRRTLESLTAAGEKPRFIYTLPTYHNPTGAVMPRERRLEMIEAARDFDVLLVEDNCYGDVHYDDAPRPPQSLYALANGEGVVYIGSLSKILGAGVRIGYLLARQPLQQRFLDERFDAGQSTLSSSIVAELLRGRLPAQIERNNAALLPKRDALLGALAEQLGGICTWRKPAGAMFLWVGLPEEVDREALFALSERRGLEYGYGAAYHAGGEDVPFLRLAYACPSSARIQEGVDLLAGCLRELAPASF
ncbi:MAG: PLP-dependent aminotransferase family protein [Holophagales bacterium]|nr:PLP-dependent aminotransferase family protein [Holophagales bacterium]MYD24165.1 PLP-dependent aminotransferase family protein [Holophagales bacterium]MYI34677.1 PLP-dependent aminotransferase family protein [Holophagales bacterium]